MNEQEMNEYLHLDDPLIALFIKIHAITAKAEKSGEWSNEEKEVYDKGDWKVFSKLRGYSEEEIGQFEKWIDTANAVSDKYGEDFSCELSFLCDESYEVSPP